MFHSFLNIEQIMVLNVSQSQGYWKQKYVKYFWIIILPTGKSMVLYICEIRFPSLCVHAIDAVQALSTIKTMHPFRPCNIQIRASSHLALTLTQFSDIAKERKRLIGSALSIVIRRSPWRCTWSTTPFCRSRSLIWLILAWVCPLTR